MPDAYFFVPRQIPFDFPEDYDTLDWTDAGRVLGQGAYVLQAAWLHQTGIRLRKAGWRIEFVRAFPERGLVVSTVWDLPKWFRAPPSVTHVCVLGDGYAYAFADIYVSQNPVQARTWHGDRLRPVSRYVPHWPQPNILPRDPHHGSRFRRIGFSGHVVNLAPELQSQQWRDSFAANGFEWAESALNEWHDYRNLDAVISCRRFSRDKYVNKPATKMYNAWLAKVPFIATPESAFVAERRHPDEAAFVQSPDELLRKLIELRDQPALRARMVQSGISAGDRFATSRIVDQWQRVLTDDVEHVRAMRTNRGMIGKAVESLYFGASVLGRGAASKLHQAIGGQA